MANLSQLTLPVKDATTGEVTNQTFDLPSGGSGGASSPEEIGIGYGTCSTAYVTTAKVATLADYDLVKNGIVAVRFTNAVNAGATLNINSKGAKAIYYRGSAITDKVINIGDIATFVYDGLHYNLIACDNIFKAYVTVHGDPNGTVTVTNSAIGLSDTLVLNSSGFGSYYCNRPGTYVFTQ